MPTKTQALIDHVTEQIRAGAWAPGAKLPSARELREQFGVSQAVVREAVLRLKLTGWVTTAPGAGWYVAERPPI